MTPKELKNIIETHYKLPCQIIHQPNDVAMVFFIFLEQSILSISLLLDGKSISSLEDFEESLEHMNIVGINTTDRYFNKDITNFILNVLKIEKIL